MTPLARAADSVAISAHARFTVVTPECIRLEYSAKDQFVDEPSLFATDRARRFKKAQITIQPDGSVAIDTGKLKLSYHPDGNPFSPANLSIAVTDYEGKPVTWVPGLTNARNLGGTLNSLDHVIGSITPIDEHLVDQPQWVVALDNEVTWAKTLTLSPGVLSRDGWYLLDDSKRMLIGQDGWAKPRAQDAGTDWYFFGYGSDYKGALRSLTAIGGAVPLPRRYTLGSWYSRFWPYSAQNELDILGEYKQHDFPLDMLVLDMDWHRGTDPATSQAYYTGYSWNTKLFPDPAKFLAQVHAEGIHVTLNDHPGDGVRSWEDHYADFARALGQDPATGAQYAFDGSSQTYISAFFDILHDPTEKIGADFWWVDWMGDWDKPFNHIDWVNELYFRHSMEGSDLRGQGFARWADWGDHRHPLHFSGDADIDWPTLALEVPFTATSSNIGAFFWTHDIGGFAGTRNGELFARWAQFGAFSAALRLHSTRDATLDKRPWTYAPWIEDSLRTSFRVRDELFPYTYSMVWKAHAKSTPLVKPLYVEYPTIDEAYRNPQEYLYGDAFLVAPITTPLLEFKAQKVWFPPGRWYHWFTGEVIDGPTTRSFYEGLNSFPVFVRGGTPIPMQPTSEHMAAGAPQTLRVALFPGKGRSVSLYEDDGETTAYLKGAHAVTRLTQSSDANSVTLTLQPQRGSYQGQPSTRDIVLELHQFPAIRRVFVDGQALALSGTDSVRIPAVGAGRAIICHIEFN